MSKSVVSDHMPSFHQFANDVGTLLHVAADKEKCGLNIVPSQDFQEALSVRIVGTVVESERQLLGSAGQPSESPAKPLPRRGHRLIARGTSSSDCSSGKDTAVHVAAIVNAGERFQIRDFRLQLSTAS